MTIELIPLSQVDPLDLPYWINNPSLRKHMPLAAGDFDISALLSWVEGKEAEAIWAEHGYGPWAFLVDGSLAGWGGFQSEDGEVDLALVLRSSQWGTGKALFDEIVRRGFNDFGF